MTAEGHVLRMLQWGRSFSERRTRTTPTGTDAGPGASMGPLFFRAENLPRSTPPPPPARGFNGAALFQSGEPPQCSRESPQSLRLQWGRSFSERRTAWRSGLSTPAARCFNGAALFQSGEQVPLTRTPHAPPQLQWGRSFSERRTGQKCGRDLGHHRASMGPLFFRAENVVGLRHAVLRIVLQWGRSFSERRTDRRELGQAGSHRFNGAALFQSGEPQANCVRLIASASFNGAALFQSGERGAGNQATRDGGLQWGRSFSERRTSSSYLVSPLVSLLQWGRSFSERRTSPACQPGRARRFNGAALFQSGELAPANPNAKRAAASMGPLFFRAENNNAIVRLCGTTSSFNGAALFQSGERVLFQFMRFAIISFNGAALFQSGEPGRAPDVAGQGFASMGPLFFRAENQTHVCVSDR